MSFVDVSANNRWRSCPHERPKEPFFQRSPYVTYQQEKTGTAAQLELFKTVPDSYEFIEKLLAKLPRKQLQEHFRNLYLREYRSVADDGSIAFAFGNKQRRHANTWLRETLGARLRLVFAQYRCNMAWLLAFDERDPKWLADLKFDIARTETPADLVEEEKAIEDYESRLLSEQYEILTLRKNFECYSREERQRAKMPFYLLSETKLKEIAYKLASMFAEVQRSYMLDLVEKGQTALTDDEFNEHMRKIYQICGEACESIGFPVAHWNKHKKGQKVRLDYIDTVFHKIACEKYWLKRMRKVQKQMVEHIAIGCGEVCKRRSNYISRSGFASYLSDLKKNYDFLKQMIIENIDDPTEQAELFDMYLKSSANPAQRRIELMTRLRGLEEWAEDAEHHALFLTLTAPSKFHATHNDGTQNKKWQGASPKQTQAYLNKVWGQFRALLKKRKIAFYGMRVAEPHHDATPHWHLLVYIHKSHRDEVARLFREKALELEGDEQGAQEHRCKIEDCDKAKGTPTGYIAKYISKNINGFALDGERSDEDANMDLKDNAKKAQAWARLWGIRQFQFYGDKYVGVWRELRRLVYGQADDELVEEARICADLGDYAAFMKRLGGPLALRKEVPLCLHYEDSEVNQYQESHKKINGVTNKFSLGDFIKTRLKKWVIKKGDPNRHNKELERSDTNNAHSVRPWTCVSNCNLENLEKREEIIKKIKEAVRPISKPLNDHVINHLLKGRIVRLNDKQSIKVINDDVFITEHSTPLRLNDDNEPSYLAKLRGLFRY
ncbi:replication protein [Canicola haemoglobinophilus]|uniref:Bacteriophage replication gene A n=1 Tax=Canicola haemoglobinophilus TaxID=733 RepID=A0A1V4AYA7_9PAST|nr:replication endonuclease [Canicola haemoglobinophilus]OOR95525.1 replication protein [Canicola haemoglobinophilus]STO58847.1 bacteriophage replication gene A [Canicola haemoglobinophilus]